VPIEEIRRNASESPPEEKSLEKRLLKMQVRKCFILTGAIVFLVASSLAQAKSSAQNVQGNIKTIKNFLIDKTELQPSR